MTRLGVGLPRHRTGEHLAIAAMLALAASLSACQGGKSTTAGKDGGAGTEDSGTEPVDSGQPTMDGGTAPNDGGTTVADAGTSVYIVSITPPNGPVTGGTVVVIVGGGFANGFAPQAGPTASLATTVKFGSNEASSTELSVVDDNTIQLTIPPGDPGASDVVVTNPNGSGGCATCFTYYGVVQLNTVTPSSGTTLGGTSFTLSGTGFVAGQTVLFGSGEAQNLTFSADGTTITGTTPPGAAGSANVGVLSADTTSILDRGFVYVAPIQINSVTPSASPLAGGGTAVVNGTGFTVDCEVTLGSTPATTTFNAGPPASLTIQMIPPATTAGPVSVTVTSARATATLQDGFAYYDPSANELEVLSVAPQQGPLGGCPGCLTLTGSAFLNDGTLEIAVGVNQATHVIFVNSNTVKADLPAATAPGIVSIFARASNGNAVLPNSFAYVSPLGVTSISPSSGPASGMPVTTATIATTGFGAGCSVFIGAEQAIVTASTSTTVTVDVPPGSTGPADVRIACGTPGTLTFQQATLSGGYTYTSAIAILQVTPNSGAIAGNTAVTVYGDGFATGLSVLFGSAPATSVVVVSPFEATMLTPPGNVGFVNVTAELPNSMATLSGGFGYFDPKNSTGGGSGGPMNGILNVTVLDDAYGFYGDPVPGVTISINADQLTGTTNANGEVTFSNSSLLKPVNISAILAGYETVTFANINARDVTLFMDVPMGSSSSSSMGPPQPPPATFTGTVCGFKLPPTQAAAVANGTLKAEAQVFFTYPYVYAAPPFGFPSTPVVISHDCGTWEMQTSNFGATAIYAIFGTVDSTGNFTPFLMTVQSDLQAIPGQTLTVPLVLNMELDLTIPITIEVEGTVTNQTYSYLDLGGAGVVPLANTTSLTNSFSFNNHPDVAGQSIIFLNMSYVPATGGETTQSVSFYYMRQEGPLGAGVTIGPMLPFTDMSTPMHGGDFTGALGWTLGAGPQPDLQQISVTSPGGLPVWSVVLPGTSQGVSLPPSAITGVDSVTEAGGMYTWTLTTASSPRFEYDYFSYDQLGLNAWTAFTQNASQFQVP